MTSKIQRPGGRVAGIIGPNGRPLRQQLNPINPKKLGIEEVIRMQDENGGKGVKLTNADLMTCIIYELARVKGFVTKNMKTIKELKEEIEILEEGMTT